jgi:hypothetical protein
VWAHGEVTATPTTQDWRVVIPSPRPVVTRAYDSSAPAAPPPRRGRHRRPDPSRAGVGAADDRVVHVDLG